MHTNTLGACMRRCSCVWAGEMAWSLRAYTALAEDPSSVQQHIRWLTTASNSSSKEIKGSGLVDTNTHF